ncbi:MAG: DUF1631 family protein, partial [Pseudomonadota bacterium]
MDPRNLINALHQNAAVELVSLMDGFYSNIEDGLFELAYTNENQDQQRRTVELMRELRFRREHLLKVFSRRLQSAVEAWFAEDKTPEYLEERLDADRIATKCASHFSGLLQMIAERAGQATGREMDRRALPISPEEVSYHFVMSCRTLEFDQMSVSTVHGLFQRFVLERMGSVYA